MKDKTKTNNPPAGTPRTIRISDLVPAPVNTHQRPSKSDPEFAGLAASMREQGMIHRIAVRPVADGRYEIIDGHRRVEAAKALGWDEVGCEVLDIGDVEAMAMTVTANVQRLENDPFLEAELIARMLAGGRSMRDAALVMGKDEAYVARRNRLNDLIPEWRRFAKAHDCTLELLRNVASHTPELQRAVAEASDLDGYGEDCGRIGWEEFEREFECRMMNLRDAAAVFDTSECWACGHNAANAGLLFPWLRDEGSATCQCESCYRRKWNAAVDALCERLRKAGKKPVEVADRWKIPNSWDLAEVSDSRHPVPYVYESNGLRRILWSVERERPRSAAANLTPEQKAQQKEQRIRERNLRDAYGRLREAYQSRSDGERRDDLMRMIRRRECHAAIVDHLCRETDDWTSDSFLDFAVRLHGGLDGFSEFYGIDGQFTDGETEAWKAHEEEGRATGDGGESGGEGE